MNLKDKQNLLARYSYNIKIERNKFIIYDAIDDDGYRLEGKYDNREYLLDEAINHLLIK